VQNEIIKGGGGDKSFVGAVLQPADHKFVRVVSWNPKYEYDPKFAWKGVNTKRKLSIGPGPNNPVGLVWIDLTDPTYGIHGTPAPSDIGKTQSHGCIRLTNWDAVELAEMVRPGDVVRFEDQGLAGSALCGDPAC
jgi:lipoprotein-anchoring transpeptidase ErfK/SrfK